jgi:hypothetical protein
LSAASLDQDLVHEEARSKQARFGASKQESKIEDEADVVFNTADFQLRTLFQFSP